MFFVNSLQEKLYWKKFIDFTKDKNLNSLKKNMFKRSFKFKTSHLKLHTQYFNIRKIKYQLKIIYLTPLPKSQGNRFQEVYRKRKRPPLLDRDETKEKCEKPFQEKTQN